MSGADGAASGTVLGQPCPSRRVSVGGQAVERQVGPHAHGLLGAAVAVGLAYAWSAVSGHPITGEEVVRHVMITFLVAGCAVGVLRGGRIRRS